MNTLQKAMAWAIAHNPNASIQHRCAFANSVQYLVEGGSGGFGGPSLREHFVSWSLAGKNGSVEAIEMGGQTVTMLHPDGSIPQAGAWSFEEACKHAAPLCFNPAAEYRNTLLQIQEREHCFDDDPEDLKELRKKSV